MAEYLWYNGQDVIIAYDDLSSHAEAYRQLSLLQEVDPGRDSYPGDIFYAHSSLLERAGKLKTNGKTLTALPVVLTPSNDITAYLSTSVMSITDGQIIFDLEIFRKGNRPAVNSGLSVSRVGGQAQTKRQKTLSSTLFKTLAKYRQAEEFSHFSSQLSKETQIDLNLGTYIYQALQQPPEERLSLPEQQLLLETILSSGGERTVDVAGLKQSVRDMAKDAKEEADYDRIEAELLKKHVAAPLAEKPAPKADSDEKPSEDKKEDDKSKKDVSKDKDKRAEGART
jgi:F-type H+-transporting ATPase subunit alpha